MSHFPVMSPYSQFLKKTERQSKKGDVIAKLTSSDLEDSITQLESQIETLEGYD